MVGEPSTYSKLPASPLAIWQANEEFFFIPTRVGVMAVSNEFVPLRLVSSCIPTGSKRLEPNCLGRRFVALLKGP